MVQVIAGFSLTNRWLLYSSFMLSPAQALSGVGSNCPSNIGFLAYNWYTQVLWYKAVKARELHALSLLPVHFNLLYCLTYLGGVTSGNLYMGLLLGFCTSGVMALNSAAAWTSWITNQPEGFGTYQFFFFGWRTLSPGWHKFFLLWQIGDTMAAVAFTMSAILVSITVAKRAKKPLWWSKYAAIIPGAVLTLVIGWPLILWTELIVSRNHIESDTDMVAVYLFIAQVVAMLVPSCSPFLSCSKGEAIEDTSLSGEPDLENSNKG